MLVIPIVIPGKHILNVMLPWESTNNSFRMLQMIIQQA